MVSGRSRRPGLALGLAVGLALCACSPTPRDEIRDRLAEDMQENGRGASDAERDEVAGALADDLVSLADDADAAAEEQAQANAAIEARYGTAEDAIARECLDLEQARATLEQIQQEPSAGERRTDEELAAIPAEIERIGTRMQEICGN